MRPRRGRGRAQHLKNPRGVLKDAAKMCGALSLCPKFGGAWGREMKAEVLLVSTHLETGYPPKKWDATASPFSFGRIGSSKQVCPSQLKGHPPPSQGGASSD